MSTCVLRRPQERQGSCSKRTTSGDANRKKAIEEFKKEKPQDATEQAKPDKKWRNVEILAIVCDMLLTGFDAPILQTMYLDKGIRDHTLLQAIARVNRPDSENDIVALCRRLLRAVSTNWMQLLTSTRMI